MFAGWVATEVPCGTPVLACRTKKKAYLPKVGFLLLSA